MRRFGISAIALGALIVMATVAVNAQRNATINPVPYDPANCVDERFDLDGNGTVDKLDYVEFVMVSHEEGNCLDESGNPIADGTCDPKLDVDGNGTVNNDDEYHLMRHVYSCVMDLNTDDGRSNTGR